MLLLVALPLVLSGTSRASPWRAFLVAWARSAGSLAHVAAARWVEEAIAASDSRRAWQEVVALFSCFTTQAVHWTAVVRLLLSLPVPILLILILP